MVGQVEYDLVRDAIRKLKKGRRKFVAGRAGITPGRISQFVGDNSAMLHENFQNLKQALIEEGVLSEYPSIIREEKVVYGRNQGQALIFHEDQKAKPLIQDSLDGLDAHDRDLVKGMIERLKKDKTSQGS